jgi:hypothetical protein
MSADRPTPTPHTDAPSSTTDQGQPAAPPADAGRQPGNAHARQPPGARTRQDYADAMLARPPGRTHEATAAARAAPSSDDKQSEQAGTKHVPVQGPGAGQQAGHRRESRTRQELADAMLAHPPGHAGETTARVPTGHDSRQKGQAPGRVAPADTAGDTGAAAGNTESQREGQNGQPAHAATAGTERHGPGEQQRGPGELHSPADDPPDTNDQGSATLAQEADSSREATGPREAAGPGNATELTGASGQSERQDTLSEPSDAEALRQRIADLEAANAKLEAESAAKDAVIAEQHDAIEAKDGLIASQWRVISELDYRIDDPAAGNAESAAVNSDLRAERAGPEAGQVDQDPGKATHAGRDRAGAAIPDGGDQSRMPDKPAPGDDEAVLEDARARLTAEPSQESEKSKAEQGWSRLVPANETAVLLAGAVGMGTTIASVAHYMSDGWSAGVGAAITFVVGGVAWVNKNRKKGSDGSQSQD